MGMGPTTVQSTVRARMTGPRRNLRRTRYTPGLSRDGHRHVPHGLVKSCCARPHWAAESDPGRDPRSAWCDRYRPPEELLLRSVLNPKWIGPANYPSTETFRSSSRKCRSCIDVVVWRTSRRSVLDSFCMSLGVTRVALRRVLMMTSAMVRSPAASSPPGRPYSPLPHCRRLPPTPQPPTFSRGPTLSGSGVRNHAPWSVTVSTGFLSVISSTAASETHGEHRTNGRYTIPALSTGTRSGSRLSPDFNRVGVETVFEGNDMGQDIKLCAVRHARRGHVGPHAVRHGVQDRGGTIRP